MLKKALEPARRWIPPLRTQQRVYQQWTHADTTELQTLAAEPSNKSNIGITNTSYQPHSPTSSTATRRRTPKSWIEGSFEGRLAGWRFGVLNFAAWASVVFLINLIVTIWGSTAIKERGVFFEGDCDRVKRLNSGLHVLINILSTVLLSGSNYCMQCLSAPTRSEIDWAHSNAGGTWLDIGVPGVRNIKHISRRRKVLWCLLGLSSLPLHLFYNSAVFSSISANSYLAFSVSKSFIEDTQCLNCTTEPDFERAISNLNQRTYPKSLTSQRYLPIEFFPSTLETLWNEARAGTLDRLEPAECINQYAQIIQSNKRNLLLVADDSNFPPPGENYYINGSRAYWAGSFSADSASGASQAADAYNWICSGVVDSDSCSIEVDNVKRVPESWRVGWYCDEKECTFSRWPVEYCLSQRAVPHCKLHFEPNIAIVITVLNLVKAALMFYITFRVQDEPLMTMGDAVASFLVKNDPTTKDMCLSSFQDFKKNNGYGAGPQQWHNTRYKWKDVTSKTRRIVTTVMFLLALATVSALLAYGIRSLPENTTLSRLGYGTVDPRTSVSGMPNNLVANAIVANIPQIILSFLYFSYNALFTAMLMGYEWTSYASKRKGLRVSHRPSGQQRSTYFLQLPYRFGMPLLVLSGTLHWLVSQSIFLVAIDYYDVYGNAGLGNNWDAQDFKTLGYSPSAIISVVVLGSLMVVSIVGFGYVPYKRGMPLAGSCSMAISAACHMVGEDKIDGSMAAVKKLQWGVVSKGRDGVGHCAFSTKSVEALVEGEVYAGG